MFTEAQQRALVEIARAAVHGSVTGRPAPMPDVADLPAATGAFERVINVCAFLFVASYVVSFAALFVLRRREPDAPRPFRAWGHPWTTGLALAGSTAFLLGVVAVDPRGALVSVACVAVTPLVYWAMRRRVADA